MPPRCSTPGACPWDPGVAIVTNAGGPRRHGHRLARRARRAPCRAVREDDGTAGRSAAPLLEPRQPRRRAGRRDQRPVRRGGQGVPGRPRSQRRHPAVHASGQRAPRRDGQARRRPGQGLPEAGDHRPHGWRQRRRRARDLQVGRDSLLQHARGGRAHLHEHVPVRTQPRAALPDARRAARSTSLRPSTTCRPCSAGSPRAAAPC